MAEELSQREMLDVLLESIERHSPSLGVEARGAVNEGTDREEIHVEFDAKTGRKKEHRFRQRVPLATEDALDRILDLLTSRLVELPMAINSVQEELGRCFENSSAQKKQRGQNDENLSVALELGGASDLVRDQALPTLELTSYPQSEIDQLRSLIEVLRGLLRRTANHDD